MALMPWFQQMMLKKDLTKEEFIEHCNEQFYHLSRFGDTVSQAKDRLKNRQDELQEELAEAKEEYDKLLNADTNSEEFKKKYESYVYLTKSDNLRYQKEYEQQVSRMEKVNEWITYIPELNRIWDSFEQPELYQSPIVSFDEWVEAKLENARRSVGFREKEIERLEELIKEEQPLFDSFEVSKQKFLDEVN